MTAYNIITHHNFYLDSAARLYEHAYAVKDHDLASGFETSLSILIENTLRDSFIGVLAVTPEQEAIGLAYGYATPQDNVSRINQIITKRLGAEWVENTFMVEGFGMHFEHHTPELATHLHEGLLTRVREAGYQRVRLRLDVPRLDGLEAVLTAQGWQEFTALAGLPHVKWFGKILD